jgi:hypothetical protein
MEKTLIEQAEELNKAEFHEYKVRKIRDLLKEKERLLGVIANILERIVKVSELTEEDYARTAGERSVGESGSRYDF